MNILDDLRAEWIAIGESLGDHIDEAAIEFVGRLKQYRSEVEGWLVHLPSERE